MLSATLLCLAAIAAGPELKRDYPIQPVPFSQVRVTDDFWAPRIETAISKTIPHAFRKCEETGRIGNFAKAGGLSEGAFEGTFFNDSDVYKVIEGAAYALALRPDPKLDAYVDEVIAKIAGAQEDDGYLYTCRTLLSPKKMPPGGTERWSNIAHGHELYCVGHLYEAAVAHYQATGKRSLLDVALKSADLICEVFGPGRRADPPGHQEIEIGLAKLYRVTGDEKYLDLAKFFLDARGRADGRRLYGPYSQDHKPVVEQDETVGHAVRAAYMYSGMADTAALTGDEAYARAVERLWGDAVSRKLYLIGGIGARGGGEGFGAAYELPNMTAYCETCASIANVLWNHRMFLLRGESKYLDVLERTLYNGVLSGIALDGTSFFYPNRLMSMGQHRRSEWFGCACCPSNLARFMVSVPGYAYAVRGDTAYVNLFVGGEADVEVGGTPVKITQDTDYPWEGTIRLTVAPSRPGEFGLAVRIPGWAQGRPIPSDLYRYVNARPEGAAPISLTVNGERVSVNPRRGFVTVHRRWRRGDAVELRLPMPIRRVLARDEVQDDRGMVALERGPLVYCLEAPDNPPGHVLNLLLPDDADLSVEQRPELLGGVRVIRGRALALRRGAGKDEVLSDERDIVAIPYHVWAHRGAGEMTVWIPREPSAARPLPAPSIASTSTARVSRNRGLVEALCDQLEPTSSNDHSMQFVHWWPNFGTEEWVEYRFEKPTRVSRVRVYWFDDEPIGGGCRIPESWTLLYRAGEEWKPVQEPSGFAVDKDTFNETTFEPVTTGGLRMEIQLRPKVSGGVLEWEVE